MLVRKDCKIEQEAALMHQAFLNKQLNAVPQDKHQVDKQQYLHRSQLVSDQD